MIKAKKKVKTVVSIRMDAEMARQLDQWLLWAALAWGQCNRYPQLVDEIFHDLKSMSTAPDIKKLNPDKNVLIRMALKNAEVEEI